MTEWEVANTRTRRNLGLQESVWEQLDRRMILIKSNPFYVNAPVPYSFSKLVAKTRELFETLSDL